MTDLLKLAALAERRVAAWTRELGREHPLGGREFAERMARESLDRASRLRARAAMEKNDE